MTAVGDVVRLPDEPPVGSVVREEDGQEWVNGGGIARWRPVGEPDGMWFTWHQLLGSTLTLTVVSLPGATS